MLPGDPKTGGASPSLLADWRRWLEKDGTPSPPVCASSTNWTLAGFEDFCLKRAAVASSGGRTAAVARPTVGLAREYVEVQRLERAPGPAQLQQWKEALNWLFRWRRAPPPPVLRAFRRWAARTWAGRRGSGAWWRHSEFATFPGGPSRRIGAGLGFFAAFGGMGCRLWERSSGRVGWRCEQFRPMASCVSALSSIVANSHQVMLSFLHPLYSFRTVGFPQDGWKPALPPAPFRVRSGCRLMLG